MVTRCCLFLAVFGLVAFSLRADTVKLKDGTVLEGDIVAEDESGLSIYLEFSRGTITQTRKINKDDIAEIVHWTPEQREAWLAKRDYERLQRYQLSPTTVYPVEYYDQVINNAFRPFLRQHPDSPDTSNVTARIAAWQAERDLVVAGNVKVHGRWSPIADAARGIGRQRGQQLLEQARSLISQDQFESAVQQLEWIVHMEQEPELVSQAKPLLDSTRQLAMDRLGRQRQKLEADVASARQRVEQARETLKQSEALSPHTTNGIPQLAAQTAVINARRDLDSAQNHLEQISTQLDDIMLRLIALKSFAAAPIIVQAPKPQPGPSSVDSSDLLGGILAWVKAHGLILAAAGIVILFVMSRLAKG
jgi:hypothetical protein